MKMTALKRTTPHAAGLEPKTGDLTTVKPSTHGGNIYKAAEETGIPEDRLIDFSASINPLGISERVKSIIKLEIDGLVNYPDPDTAGLREAISHHTGIDPASIICGNGSTELIYIAPRALRPHNVLLTAPTFSEYENAVRVESTEQRPKIKELALKEDNNFEISVEEFIAAMKGCDMAFLCNPNNPTGQILKKEDVLKIARAAASEKCTLIVDEAFIDFTPEETVINEVSRNQHLIVLRSMTKFYAITGLRLGYAAMHESLISRIRTAKEPWSVNYLAQKAGAEAVMDMEYAGKTHNLMIDEKKYMENSFIELGIPFIPSAANYYLFKVPQELAMVEKLKQQGILVRNCSNFSGLDSSYIRVAVKSHEHNEILIKEMGRICKE